MENQVTQSQTQNHVGVDLLALQQWLEQHKPELVSGELSTQLIQGGKSNLTYELTDGEHEWILRRPPVGEMIATAHDMNREYTMASALNGTEVPVPNMIAYCDDKDVMGADFYIMEKIDGVPYRLRSELEPLGAGRAAAIGRRLISTLATLHRVRPEEVGLENFGKPAGFLSRQVKRWKNQIDASYTRDLPDAARLHAALETRIPDQTPAGIVHGDYRLDNVLIGPDDRPAAVIDWELATLGDPLMDVALMLIYQKRAKIVSQWAENYGEAQDVTLTPGYPTEQQIIEQYAQESGRDMTHFNFYLALACFKLAGISEGVRYRYLNGQTVGEGFENSGNTVPLLLELGLDVLKEY